MHDLPSDFAYVTKRDMRSEPFERVVVLGESHVAQGTWVCVFAALLKEFQGPPEPEIIRAGIGGNAISQRSPGYPASAKPSALERYQDDVIAHNPDLAILSYGLNDMRAGMPTEDFREDLTTLVREVKVACDPVIVLTTVYNMSAYRVYAPFDKGSIEAAEVYNLIIRQVAEAHDAVVADIWAAQGMAPWGMTPDTVHANTLGHTLIGHRVFEAVATNCSGAAKSLYVEPEEALRELKEKHDAALGRVVDRLESMEDAAAGDTRA